MSAGQERSHAAGADTREWGMRALAVYVRRGEHALQDLNCGEWDRAEATLKARTAAWHNFMAAAGLLETGGAGLRDLFGRDTWERVLTLNELLERAIEDARSRLQQELGELMRTRQKLTRYRTHEGESPRFSGAV